MNYGRLDLIIGPMFAGKSTELIKIIKSYQILEKNILIINHVINNRYGTNGISTHDQVKVDSSININYLSELEEKYIDLFKEAEIIIIEELQFFEDAFEHITSWIDTKGKHVIGAGLISDFQKKPFGDVLKLIPHAENITKLSALCKICKDGTKACFTKRKVKEENTIMVGSDICYEAVCRKHYLQEF